MITISSSSSSTMATYHYHHFLLLPIFCLLLFSPSLTSSLDLDLDDVTLFNQWKEEHRKLYSQMGEMQDRFDKFKENLKYVRERTFKNRTEGGCGGFTVGLNRFADLSNEEFKERYFGSKVKMGVRASQRLRLMSSKSQVKSCDVPPSLDWRRKGAVTQVKDQGKCGSCWAFSTTGAIEGINAISTGKAVSLSEQELIDCDTSDAGCDGGLMDDAYEWVIHNGGIDTDADYPYTGAGGTCIASKKSNKITTIDGYVDLEQSENAILCAVTNQPVSVGIVGSSLDFQLYTGGVYDGDCSCNPKDIDHAVLIVGYGSLACENYWIVKNSWGTGWGMDGYIYIRRNTNAPYGVCAINSMASFPTLSNCAVSPDPAPTPPSPPSPTACGDFSYCAPGQACCCVYELFGFCMIYGCCEYNDGVCCPESDYCCPADYPVCDISGMCLKKSGDSLGIAAKKKKLAKHKLPWINYEQQTEDLTYQPLQWTRNQYAAER